jgi:hypothetical protein
MTLRSIRYLGYKIPDLAWLMMREIEYFYDDEDRTASPGESDSAFSI